MKTSTYIICYLLTFSAWGQKADNSQSEIQSISFGVYCGECRKDCATMYRLTLSNKKPTLEVDTKDSFFKKKGELTFDKLITDKESIELASKIQNEIPDSFLTTTKESQEFGCPDCTDGCGVYFELRRNTGTNKFYLDTDTEKLNGEVKTFYTVLIQAIKGLEK
jgi:hypothetical protein